MTDSLTLILDGELEEQFGEHAIRCPQWHLLYKQAGTPHSSESRNGRTRMLILTHTRVAGLKAPSGVPVALPSGALGALALSLLEQPGSAERVLRAMLERLQGTGFDAPDWIQETVHRITKRPSSPLRLSSLAAAVSVHRVHLARVFRENVGCSVDAFIRRTRIDAAVHPIIQSDVPLSALALDLGFHDQSHFSTQFLRETGWTPGQFRRTVRTLRAS